MSRSPLHPIPLLSVGSQDTPASLPPLLPPLQNPSSRSWASPYGPSTWGLSCLLALQHFLVLTSLLWASHLLLLHNLPPGGLSYPLAQLLASSFFSCGTSTVLQTWMGSRLPLIQAPSLEFLIPALVLTNQKLPLMTKTPGNASLSLHLCSLTRSCHGLELWNTSLREVSGAVVVSGLLQGTIGLLGVPGRVFPFCGPLVLAPSLVVAGLSAHKEVAQFCSAHWGLALLYAHPAHGGVLSALGFVPGTPLLLEASFSFNSQLYSCLQTPFGRWGSGQMNLDLIDMHDQVLAPVACVWLISAFVGLSALPLPQSEPSDAPWFWLPHPGEWEWPLMTSRALAAGISMALAASTSSLGCYALCGQLLHLSPPPPHACSRGLSLEGLGSVLAGLLGSPLGTASSFPNVGTVSLFQTGSRRVAHLVGLFCMGLGLSPRLAQLFINIPLPVLGGVLGVTQAVVLSAGFSSFHLADIDSGRNVFIVGFSIFMALLLPRWLREAPILLNTGWSPLDIFLRSLLAEPIFLAGLLGFLLENTISGTRIERGLGQGLPTSFTAQETQMLQKSRKKAAQEYGLPLPINNLCSYIPQPLHCLCPMPEDSGDEGGSPKTGETADLLPNSGESCSTASREVFMSQ